MRTGSTFIGRVASGSVALVLAMIAGARIMIDVINYAPGADTHGEQFLAYLISIPWWVPFEAALLLLVGLFWSFWPRAKRATGSFLSEEGAADQESLLAATIPNSILVVDMVMSASVEKEPNPYISFYVSIFNGSPFTIGIVRASGSLSVQGQAVGAPLELFSETGDLVTDDNKPEIAPFTISRVGCVVPINDAAEERLHNLSEPKVDIRFTNAKVVAIRVDYPQAGRFDISWPQRMSLSSKTLRPQTPVFQPLVRAPS